MLSNCIFNQGRITSLRFVDNENNSYSVHNCLPIFGIENMCAVTLIVTRSRVKYQSYSHISGIGVHH